MTLGAAWLPTAWWKLTLFNAIITPNCLSLWNKESRSVMALRTHDQALRSRSIPFLVRSEDSKAYQIKNDHLIKTWIKNVIKLARGYQQSDEANMPSIVFLTFIPKLLEQEAKICESPSVVLCTLRSLLTSLHLGLSGVYHSTIALLYSPFIFLT